MITRTPLEGIGIGIFNDNIDENQTTKNHGELQDQGMRPLEGIE